jgi:Secretion system C-terminal sorting domain
MKKLTLLLILTAFVLQLFAQFTGGGRRIIIEDLISGTGGGTTLTTISTDVIHDGDLPTHLSILDDLNNARTTYEIDNFMITYNISVTGCLGSNSNQCQTNFNLVCVGDTKEEKGLYYIPGYYKRAICDIYPQKQRQPQDGLKLTKTDSKATIETMFGCKSRFKIDFVYTEFGFDLETYDIILPSSDDEITICKPTVKITKSVQYKANGALPIYNKVSTYPNPTTGKLQVNFEAFSGGQAAISVYNNLGVLVQSLSAVDAYKGFNNTELDLENLPSGLYNIVIQQGNDLSTQRVQKL